MPSKKRSDISTLLEKNFADYACEDGRSPLDWKEFEKGSCLKLDSLRHTTGTSARIQDACRGKGLRHCADAVFDALVGVSRKGAQGIMLNMRHSPLPARPMQDLAKMSKSESVEIDVGEYLKPLPPSWRSVDDGSLITGSLQYGDHYGGEA